MSDERERLMGDEAAAAEVLADYVPREGVRPTHVCFGFWELGPWRLSVGVDGLRTLYRWWSRPRRHGHPSIDGRLAAIVEVDVPGDGRHRAMHAQTRRGATLIGVAMDVSLFEAVSRVDGHLALYQARAR